MGLSFKLVPSKYSLNVSNNISKDLPKDESKGKFKLPKSVKELYKRKWWGDKTKQGYYKKIINKEGKKESTKQTIKTDEGPRKETSLKALSKLKPAFKVMGQVTAGNSSQMSDGAAFVLVMLKISNKRPNNKHTGFNLIN